MSRKLILILIISTILLLFFIHFKFNLCFYNCNFDDIEIHKNIVEDEIGELSIFLLTTKEEAEDESLLRMANYPKLPQVPFGLINKEWEQFIINNKNTKLYFFKTDEKSWNALSGRKGYVLILRNRLVDIFIMEMS